uniref:Uncharacterized protein n=1 Tax=Neolamprologus brichardi TaxID=32507 RepID=A0A3Q4GJE8_NEOBR
ITREASFRARDAFISPSAAITCAWIKTDVKIIFTSFISTRSTLIPQLSVASSKLDWKSQEDEMITSTAYSVNTQYVWETEQILRTSESFFRY